MVRIRLRRVGKRNQPSYRVVVADARSPRDGRFIETIGHYNPRTDPPTVVIRQERALYWLLQGAQPTDAVDRMLRNLGVYEKLRAVRQGASIEEVLAAPEAEAEEVAEVGVAVAEAEPEAVEAAEAEAEEVAAAEAVEAEAAPEEEAAEAITPAQVTLADLGVSTRVENLLRDAGLETAQDLLDRLAQGDAELLSIPGIGGKALEEVKQRLAERGWLE